MKYIAEYSKGEVTSEFLFNLETDPAEKNSLLESDSKTARKLHQKLDEWEKEVKSPRLADFVK